MIFRAVRIGAFVVIALLLAGCQARCFISSTKNTVSGHTYYQFIDSSDSSICGEVIFYDGMWHTRAKEGRSVVVHDYVNMFDALRYEGLRCNYVGTYDIP